jgi:hypothetical protein
VRRRQPVQAFAQRGPGDRERVDAVGLAATARLAPRGRHQRAVHAQHSLAALDQKPLQRTRHMPAVLDRPDAFVAETARPPEQSRGALGPGRDGLLPEQLAGRR